MTFIMQTENFINSLLKISIYITIPSITPKNINILSSPLLNLKIEYNNIRPLITQNITSCIYVIKSGVLKLFLNILNTSKSIPIKNPLSKNIAKTYD